MSIRTFLKQCLKRTRDKQQVYLFRLKQLFLLTNEELETTIAPFFKAYRRSDQLDLFEADTG